MRSGRRACFRSRSAKTRRATAFAAWYGKLWLAPNALKRRALTDTVKGIYLPYWTFDAQVDATWTAEAGHYYYTTETYTDNGGRTQTRQVQHVRWEPAAGRLQHFFDDDLICASVGVHPDLLRGIEPFPTNELVAYDPGYVAGWIVERYQIDLVAAAKAARDAMDAKLQQMCAAQVPGDTYRNLQVHAELFGPDLQAHPRAGVAVELHVRREGVSGGHERRQRHDTRRVSEELDQDHAAGARDSDRVDHRDVDGQSVSGTARSRLRLRRRESLPAC